MRSSGSKNKSITTWLVVGAVAVGALGTWRYLATPSKGTARLANQVWIERMPTGERDRIHHMVLIDHPRAKLGALGFSSRWRANIEGLRWNLSGDTLSIVMPQDDRHAKVKVRTWSCKGEAPKPFELCLELSQGERKFRYYSMKDWEIDVRGGEAAPSEALIADLPKIASEVRELSDNAKIDEAPTALTPIGPESDFGAL